MAHKGVESTACTGPSAENQSSTTPSAFPWAACKDQILPHPGGAIFPWCEGKHQQRGFFLLQKYRISEKRAFCLTGNQNFPPGLVYTQPRSSFSLTGIFVVIEREQFCDPCDKRVCYTSVFLIQILWFQFTPLTFIHKTGGFLSWLRLT